jgi:hypothetical protein
LIVSKVRYIPGGEGGVGLQYNIYNSSRSLSLASRRLNVMLLLNSKKAKQSRYRPGVAQRVPGS